ncbi:Glycosyltransferase involved in cell wall bisynthesis [Pontibaca methylaminivorans]|uniref:Glycosyltransferase involved in cell wall bisynthesis n=2 Tax=Pontibaca methylaminivorans TaxID=515897 RepID=A0A1R3X857_9RHOB|nr:Glycosyltransferase involved in cell wall bisynthesis [Pontibaca methylaminivorans]
MPFTFHPDHINSQFLGQIELPGAHPSVPTITILVAIPRKPLPIEMKQTEAPWVPVRKLRAVHRFAPMIYEKIRYHAEMLRKQHSIKRHSQISLPIGEGSTLFSSPQQSVSDKRPAILIGMHWLEVGGAEKLGFDTIQWALEAGLRVFVVAGVPSIQRMTEKLPNSPDVTFLRLDRYLPHHLWPRYVEKLIRTENIQLIHIHHCRPLYESLPQVRAKLPWVTVIDSTHIIEYADGGFPRISGVWSNFIDLHHVISKELIDYYRENFHLIGKVKLGRMLKPVERQASLPELNMKPGKKRLQVAFVGRLYYQKRPVIVAEAFRALSIWAKRNNVVLAGKIVGEGPFLDTVRELLRRYGIACQIELLPANSPVSDILRQSDILLLPSNNEGLALVCYEAVEQGCIPISTNVGSQAEIIPPDLLVPLEPHACVRGIVRAVNRLWHDADFLSCQREALVSSWSAIMNEPTARDILMPVYQDAAASLQE